jgi:DNA-binding winged helix-turn-helix (wHTH) protein
MKGSFRVGEWLIRPELWRIVGRGKSVRVEPKVMQVLEALAESAGEMVPREELIRGVWEGAFVTDDVLTRCISILRKIFDDRRSRPRVIETISKRGYRLIAPVARADASRDANHLLAVLPFVRADGDAEAESWCEALVEAVIETLTDVPRLRVSAWSTLLGFLGGNEDPLAVARALGAEAALAGRAVRRGGRLTLFVELAEVANSWRLWGARYESNPAAGMGFPGVEDFARQIAAQIRAKLIAGEASPSSTGSPADSEALETEGTDEAEWLEVLETSPT